ncbi:8933_t:CDS:2 [Dentiscutata erythropus]|uniref:8933_t:CDS:1 n=1 Tax=Dentiscutata erythropus TaxID=1348616 RepID=A0A9N9F2M6_9GLOM|nr:8933_t:CDS:2 [Dentiscutata erythropus]
MHLPPGCLVVAGVVVGVIVIAGVVVVIGLVPPLDFVCVTGIFSSYGACLVFIGSGNCADVALDFVGLESALLVLCDIESAPSFGEVTIVDVIVGVTIFVGFWGLSMFVAYFVT